jgi:hypothetical protein
VVIRIISFYLMKKQRDLSPRVSQEM